MPTLTRILLIDDDAVDRQAVRRTLAASDLQWDLTEAKNGQEGLELASREAFDCVLLDYRLPDVDAFEVLARLISPDGGRHAVLILTGESDPDIAYRLMRAGALDHLSKGEMAPQTLARAIRYAKARRAFLAETEEARREAEEKSAALDALNRQKALLLSIIAHDLRNPFQLLIGLSDTLSHAVADRDPPKIEARAQGLRAAAEEAHLLMEGLFDWAKLQMENAETVLAPVDMQRVAEKALQACRPAARNKDITLAVECGPTRPLADHDMLATILRNLIGNAIKFTPPQGRISLACREEPDGMAVIEVRDTGVGMSEAVVAKLFRSDLRVTTAGTLGEKGSGFGLLLCKDLAERMGSTLSVVSEPGVGTCFSLRLRCAPPLREDAVSIDAASC